MQMNSEALLQSKMESILHDIGQYFDQKNKIAENIGNRWQSEEEDIDVNIEVLMTTTKCFIDMAQLCLDTFDDTQSQNLLNLILQKHKQQLNQLSSELTTKNNQCSEIATSKCIPPKTQLQVQHKKKPTVRQMFSTLDMRIPKVSVTAFYLFYILKSKELESVGGSSTTKEQIVEISSLWKELSKEQQNDFHILASEIKQQNQNCSKGLRKDEQQPLKNGKVAVNQSQERKQPKKSKEKVPPLNNSQSQLFQDILSNSLSEEVEIKPQKQQRQKNINLFSSPIASMSKQ